VDSAAGGSPAVPRAAKADAPPAPPRRADRSRTEDDLPAGGDPEASLSDPGENRRVSRAVMAGGMFGLMALGALLAWMFQLGAPVEPLPPPAPAPVARPAVTPPPPVRPQAPETRPASGSAAPLVRPASASVPGAELPPEGAPSAPTPAESPGNDRKAARVGFLTVEASPWANVYVGGKKLGQTPISRAPVEEGVVPVLLTNPQTGRSVSRKVRVMAGKTVNVKEDLR
jgi:serine/threonine-protein kinase